MRTEILGSGEASTFCSCAIYEEAHDKGVPVSRLALAYFFHDANIFIDISEEIGVTSNRSRIKRVDAKIYRHWHPDHLDETNQLSYDDCLTLAKQLDAGNISFAYDLQIVSI